MKLYADDKYFNTDKTSGLTDLQYDMLKETLKRRDPNYVVPIGARMREGGNRVKLPYWLGSMDKIKMDLRYKKQYVIVGKCIQLSWLPVKMNS